MWMDRKGEKEVYTYAKRYYPVHARGALVRAAMKFSTSSSTPPSTTARPLRQPRCFLRATGYGSHLDRVLLAVLFSSSKIEN